MAVWDRITRGFNDLIGELAAPDAIREELQAGAEALEQQRPEDAERAFRRVIAADSGHARAWHLLGVSLLEQDQLEPALEALERAAALRSGDYEILVDLAEARQRAGQTDLALAHYKRALRCRTDGPSLARVYRALGDLYLQRGAWDHAVRELRKAVALGDGDDLELMGWLGRAQYHSGDLSLARHSLSRAATAAPPDRQVLLLLTRVLLELGQHQEAALAPRRLLELDPQDASAHRALARCLLAAGELEPAREQTLRALQGRPRDPELHRLLGEVHAAAGDAGAAQNHLQSALDLWQGDPPADLLRQVLLLEAQQDQAPGLADHARRLLRDQADDPLGLACLGLALADEQPDQAMELLSRSLAAGETHEARLGLGWLLLLRGQPQQAAVALRVALRLSPAGARARRLLSRAYRELSGEQVLEADLYPFLRRVNELLSSDPELSPLSPEVTRIQEVFDRPLLLCVMGEFNSGKSTFVNALIGEKVAPMGITPTTATINVLKYGARRGARVVWRDDREQLLEWAEVGPFLNGLDDERAAQVRQVELLYPAEELLRVNVVDTPGLNSLVDAHEQTAREILARADAVVWLFSAHQAGKQTEQQALELLRQHRLKTVGVLNKIDRLSAEELSQVAAHLREGFAGLVESVLPVSTRQALEAQVAGDEDALQRSRFPELREFLEQQLFARSLQIKRAASRLRLEELLAGARQQMERRVAAADRALEQLDTLLPLPGRTLTEDLARQERLKLEHDLQGIYRRGAEEVLDFVRPRRWMLGEHRAAAADRDFLLELLTDGLLEVARLSRLRLEGDLNRVGGELAGGLDQALGPAPERPAALAALEQLLQERRALLQQQVYTRYIAYARGVLNGGRVDRFFTSELPRMELDLEVIYKALRADGVDLQQELLSPLADWVGEARQALVQQLRRVRLGAELARLELDQRYLAPLSTWEQSLDRLVAGDEPESGG